MTRQQSRATLPRGATNRGRAVLLAAVTLAVPRMGRAQASTTRSPTHPNLCVDTKGFKTAYGTCQAYEDNQWCEGGSTGSGWHGKDWGPLDPKVTAACCACGKKGDPPRRRVRPSFQEIAIAIISSSPHDMFLPQSVVQSCV